MVREQRQLLLEHEAGVQDLVGEGAFSRPPVLLAPVARYALDALVVDHHEPTFVTALRLPRWSQGRTSGPRPTSWGHASTRMTMEVYQHVSDARKEEAAAKIASELLGA